MHPYQQPQSPVRPANGVRPLIVVLIAAGSLLVGCIGGATITSPPPDRKPAAAAGTPTGGRASSPAPRIDHVAGDMCSKVVQAAAYRRAGNTARAKVLEGTAVTVAGGSDVPAVKAMAGASDGLGRMASWCRRNLPEVTASPVARPRPKPKPKRTTAKPGPRPTRKDDREPPPTGGTGGTGGGRNVTPGAYCSPPGATGTSNGRTYTCKGPGRARWRQ